MSISSALKFLACPGSVIFSVFIPASSRVLYDLLGAIRWCFRVKVKLKCHCSCKPTSGLTLVSRLVSSLSSPFHRKQYCSNKHTPAWLKQKVDSVV